MDVHQRRSLHYPHLSLEVFVTASEVALTGARLCPMLKGNPLYVDISATFPFAHCSLYSDDDGNMRW